MFELWGEVLPVATNKLRVLEDNNTLHLLGHNIKVIYTPGHASHHVCYLLNDEIMFVGDSAGVKVTGSKVIRPALPPPEVNLEIWEESLAKMASYKPKKLMLTHFDQVEDPQEHFTKVGKANKIWANAVLKGLQAGEDDASLAKRIKALSLTELNTEGASADIIHRHQIISNDEMTVAGLKRYWLKHHPDSL